MCKGGGRKVYVRGYLSHEGVKLVEEVVALMEECELSSHVRQELCVCVCGVCVWVSHVEQFTSPPTTRSTQILINC